MSASPYFFIAASPLRYFSNQFPSACSFRRENRVTLNIDPVGGLGRQVTAYTVLLIVSCDLLLGCVCFVESPSPAVAPQWIAGIESFVVLDHDEPHLRGLGPVRVAGCHRSMVRGRRLFCQHGAIVHLPHFAVVFSRARGCVRDMHLLCVWISNQVRSE